MIQPMPIPKMHLFKRMHVGSGCVVSFCRIAYWKWWRLPFAVFCLWSFSAAESEEAFSEEDEETEQQLPKRRKKSKKRKQRVDSDAAGLTEF